MSDFVPPYPKRLKKLPGPVELLKIARTDLLAVWPESVYERQFIHFKIVNRSLVIANHPEIVRHALLDHSANYQRKTALVKKLLAPLIGDSVFITDGESWDRQRAVDDAALAAQGLADIGAVAAEAAAEWAQHRFANGETLQVLPEMQQLVATILSRILFDRTLAVGNVAELCQRVADYLDSAAQLDLNTVFGMPNWFSGKKSGVSEQRAKSVHDWVDGIIVQKAGDLQTATVLSGYLHAPADGPVKPGPGRERIRNSLIGLFLAGHESTANTLAWAWYLISQCPKVEQTLHEELDRLGGSTATFADLDRLPYSTAIIKETLRLYPPLPFLLREAAANDTIRNRPIPAGSFLLVAPWLLHRHKHYWDKPDHFLPERFMADAPPPTPLSYLPFGVGPRACLGEALGLQIAVLCLANLAKRFHFQADTGYQVQPVARLMLRPSHAMPMRLAARIHATSAV